MLPLPPTSPAAATSGDRAAERQAVVDDLNLAMLFVDAGRIDPDDAPEPAVRDRSDGAASERSLRVRVLPDARLTVSSAAALLCRILHNLRIPAVEITRVSGGVRMRCRYILPSGTWDVELHAPVSLP